MQVLKVTLSQQVENGRLLSPTEMQTFLHSACGIASQRPVTVRSFSLDDYMAVSPRNLLLGAAPSLTRKEVWTVGLNQDSHDAFQLIMPYRKWAMIEQEVDLGAVVMVHYVAQYVQDKYPIGRFVEVMRGQDGLARTLHVSLRHAKKGAREHWMV